MTPHTFRAAAVQTLARLGDVQHNLEIVTGYVREAALQGAHLVVFPECMNSGYLFDSAAHARELAEPLDGPYVRGLAGLCREHGLFLASGMTEWDPRRQRIFNSGVLLDRTGDVILHYHKQFLATHDQNWFAFGANGCPVVETELGRLGLMICFDGRIPEIARCLALQGAEVILDMANFFAMDQAEMFVPARAYENGVWIVAATKAGTERSIYYPGGSMIVDPAGRVRARQPYDTHGLIVQDVTPAEARRKRVYSGNDRLADRRADAYQVLGQPYDSTPVALAGSTPVAPREAVAKAAAVQMHVARGTALDDVVAMADHAAKLGVQILVFPEYAASARWAPDAAEARALAARSKEVLEQIAAVCLRYRCYGVFSHVEEAEGRLFPTAFLLGPLGELLGRYRKVHLTAEEKAWAEPGNAFPVFQTDRGRIGIMLGYDGMFPEAARCLAVEGADVIAWPASLREAFEREWLAVPRAADNRCYVVLSNRLDSPYPGGSLVIPPAGFPLWDLNQIAPPSRAMGAVMPAFLDLATSRQKQMIPKVDMFANRLTHTYGPLVARQAPARPPGSAT